jgi:hypothetical protein
LPNPFPSVTNRHHLETPLPLGDDVICERALILFTPLVLLEAKIVLLHTHSLCNSIIYMYYQTISLNYELQCTTSDTFIEIIRL